MMSALKIVFAETRRLFRQWRAVAALTAVYAALLATVFFFVAIREATIWQIILTLVFAALAPSIFFILQAMIVRYARGEGKALILLKRSLEDSCKLALASVPLALVAILLFYFLNRLETYYPAHAQLARTTQSPFAVLMRGPAAAAPTPPLRWSFVALSTLRLIIFGIVLPLIAAHLWSATLREGLLSALKGMRRHLARAFKPESLRIYIIGITLFGFVPYLLLFMHTPASRPSVEFGLFIARLLLVFLFTLLGWVLTLSALACAGNARAASGGVELIDGEQSLCEAER